MNIKNIIIFITLIITIVESKKKGSSFGFDSKPASAQCNDIRDLKVSWYYNWGLAPNCDTNIEGTPFYPTIWGKDSINSNTANTIAKADVLFTFNEPNFKDQATMLPQEASQLWPEIEKLNFKTIVGPSMADCGENSKPSDEWCKYGTVTWYKEFLGNCTNCKVDYANIHIYYCDADDVMNKITNLNKATGLKVWLTEFNCNGATTDDQVLAYAKKLLPLLESSDIVAGYAWFLPYYTEGGNVNSLYLNQDGNGDLSPIGKYYASFGSTGNTSSDSDNTSSDSDNTSSDSDNTSSTTKSIISYILLSLVLLVSLL